MNSLELDQNNSFDIYPNRITLSPSLCKASVFSLLEKRTMECTKIGFGILNLEPLNFTDLEKLKNSKSFCSYVREHEEGNQLFLFQCDKKVYPFISLSIKEREKNNFESSIASLKLASALLKGDPLQPENPVSFIQQAIKDLQQLEEHHRFSQAKDHTVPSDYLSQEEDLADFNNLLKDVEKDVEILQEHTGEETVGLKKSKILLDAIIFESRNHILDAIKRYLYLSEDTTVTLACLKKIVALLTSSSDEKKWVVFRESFRWAFEIILKRFLRPRTNSEPRSRSSIHFFGFDEGFHVLKDIILDLSLLDIDSAYSDCRDEKNSTYVNILFDIHLIIEKISDKFLSFKISSNHGQEQSYQVNIFPEEQKYLNKGLLPPNYEFLYFYHMLKFFEEKYRVDTRFSSFEFLHTSQDDLNFIMQCLPYLHLEKIDVEEAFRFKRINENEKPIDKKPIAFYQRLNLPPQPENFVGRGAEIQYLINELVDNRATRILTGIRGIGKTTLAIQFAHLVSNRFNFTYFLNCESHKTLKEQLLELADIFRIPKTLEAEERLNELKNILIKNRLLFLIIIDSVNTPVQEESFKEIKKYLPHHLGSFLVTTNLMHESKSQLCFSRYRLKPLSLEKGADLLQLLSGAMDSKGALGLVKELGGWPKILKGVGEYLNQVNAGFNWSINSSIDSEFPRLYEIKNLVVDVINDLKKENIIMKTLYKSSLLDNISIPSFISDELVPILKRFFFFEETGFHSTDKNLVFPKAIQSLVANSLNNQERLDYALEVLEGLTNVNKKDDTIHSHINRVITWIEHDKPALKDFQIEKYNRLKKHISPQQDKLMFANLFKKNIREPDTKNPKVTSLSVSSTLDLGLPHETTSIKPITLFMPAVMPAPLLSKNVHTSAEMDNTNLKKYFSQHKSEENLNPLLRMRVLTSSTPSLLTTALQKETQEKNDHSAQKKEKEGHYLERKPILHQSLELTEHQTQVKKEKKKLTKLNCLAFDKSEKLTKKNKHADVESSSVKRGRSNPEKTSLFSDKSDKRKKKRDPSQRE